MQLETLKTKKEKKKKASACFFYFVKHVSLHDVEAFLCCLTLYCKSVIPLTIQELPCAVLLQRCYMEQYNEIRTSSKPVCTP